MKKMSLALFVPLMTLAMAMSSAASAQQGPPVELRKTIDATVAMLKATDKASTQEFAREFLTNAYRESMSESAWSSRIESIRSAVGPLADELAVEAEAGGVRLVFGRESTRQVRLELGPASEWKISSIGLLEDDAAGAAPESRGQMLDQHARAIESIGQLPVETAMRMLERDHFKSGLFTGPARAQLLRELAELKSVIAGAGLVSLEKRGDQEVLKFRGDRNADVVFGAENAAPFRIDRFAIDLSPVDASRVVAPLAWNEWEQRLEAAEAKGFSGIVMVRRSGAPSVTRAYGMADRERGARPSESTVFDIGSMPIDFTRVAILFLVQTGQIAMEDRIGKYFDNVPDDKREITIASLMEGSSGLANFHHRDSDADRDLSWIDRDTAIHRILEQPLLFEPGKGKSHSHSAFGLLAAIIEIATGKDYGDYLHEILFDPAGMRRTGFYGESLGLADSEFAVGYGEQASTPNIPPRWGPASWLVIGSGGMVSSIADMQRGFDHVNSGKLLTGDRLREYQRAKLAIGGTNRGFLFLRIAADDGSVLFLASNAMQDPQEESDLVDSLISMLRPDAPETASDP